jgi:tetratricopeptide (TPR) repeat protein
MVYPGAESTVTLRILVARRRNKQALELFENGIEYYIKGGEGNYRRAEELFRKALEQDAAYSEAALYLARTYNALFDQEKAKQYFQRSVDIDPDYVEARASYGGMLLDIGDTDLAIRQLDAVIRREPRHTQAQYLLAEAFRLKGAYNESIESARRAIEISPGNAEARFWLAESLRLRGSSPLSRSQIDEAKAQYLEYLRLSDFDSRLAGKMNYYVVGFLIGKGKKKRAAQHDIWEDLRSLAFFGLCDCDRLLSNFRDAIGYCRKSLSYDNQDPFSHYALALALEHEAQAAGSTETLAAALKHFKAVLDINGEIAEAANARRNISLIQELLFGQ